MTKYRFDHIGNIKILDLPKVAFLSSKIFTLQQKEKAIAWARQQKGCIISGFQSHLEREVFNALLGKVPLIMVLGRGIFETVPHEYARHIDNSKLLIISPFMQDVMTTTKSLAFVRNYIVVEMADNVIVGALSPDGMIAKVLAEANKDYEIL